MRIINNYLKLFSALIISLLLMVCFVNDTRAEILSSWSTTLPLNYTTSNHASTSHGNHLYVINGSSTTGATQPDTLEASLNLQGGVSSWQSISSHHPALIGHESASYNNFSYIAGGLIDNINGLYTTVPTVSTAIYNSGTLGSWVNSFTPLPSDRAQGGLVNVLNRLYYLGGYQIYVLNGTEFPKHDTYFNTINIDGSLNTWSSSHMLDLAQPTYYIAAVETGKKILTLGGKKSQSDRFSRTVWQTDVNLSTGELGQWTQTHPLPDNNGLYPVGYNSIAAIRVDDYIIAVGGNVPGNQSNKVYYTKVTPDGGIEPWETSSFDLPIRSSGGTIEYVNGYLYYMGGFSNEIGGYHNRVYFTKLDLPAVTSLNVPDIKQYSLPWGPLTYDHSKSNVPTISRWGCALTSAVMILQYHGSTITPEGLNNWLVNNHGYTGNGLVKWGSISEYSKIDPNTPSLEFLYPDFSETLLKNEIDNNRPVVIKLYNNPYGGNHFIVGKGHNSEIYINDPAKSTNTILSQANTYWGGNISIGKFTPSNTDLSYINLFVNNNINIKVYDPNNVEIPNNYYHVEYPYLNPDYPNSTPEGDILKSLYYPKPVTGIYKVELSGSDEYLLDSNLYDVNGNNANTYAKGSLDIGGETKTLYIIFNKNTQSVIVDETIMETLNMLGDYNSSNVFKRGVYNHIRNSILNINKHILTDQSSVAARLIELLEIYINENKYAQIDSDYANNLNNTLQALYAGLTLNSYLASGI